MLHMTVQTLGLPKQILRTCIANVQIDEFTKSNDLCNNVYAFGSF